MSEFCIMPVRKRLFYDPYTPHFFASRVGQSIIIEQEIDMADRL